MIGAKVLWEIYEKHQDKWIVELLLNDLIDWHNWFHQSDTFITQHSTVRPTFFC